MKLKKEPERSIENTKEVFVALYEANLSRIYRYIYYRVRDVTVAEDLTSAVFEKALIKFNSYRSDKALFSTWLFSIARNTIIDHYRNVRRESTIAPNPPSEVNSGIDAVIKREEFQRLLSCFSQLSDLEQEIVSLKFASRLTNREIAKLHHLGESNVGTILYRAIRKLRAKFMEEESG